MVTVAGRDRKVSREKIAAGVQREVQRGKVTTHNKQKTVLPRARQSPGCLPQSRIPGGGYLESGGTGLFRVRPAYRGYIACVTAANAR